MAKQPASYSARRFCFFGETRSVFRSKLEVGKSCHQCCLQKLEMPNCCFKFVQSSLPVSDFGAEQILKVIVFWISR